LPVKRRNPSSAALGALSLTLLLAVPARAAAQLSPPSSGGIAELDRRLQEVTESRRVLLIGAHPDDENNQLLTLLSQGQGVEAAYLSLSRGEGGQNLIGQELGVSLGLLRSQELLSARRIDGAQQFFTRAYDFGFSKTLDEAERFWPIDSVLKDAVRIIRRFKPHVVVAIFSGTPRDGHGQHQESGVVARLAFDVAGDPSRFPELKSEEGLDAWTPLSFYRSLFGGAGPGTIPMRTGALDPRTGKSYLQIANLSRSQHRSQDFGVLQPVGPGFTAVRLDTSRVTTAEAASQDLFTGIPPDTSWMARFVDSLRATVTPARFSAVAPVLAQLLTRPSTARQRDGLQAALAIASGLVMDAITNDGDVVPGQTFQALVLLYNAGPTLVTVDSTVLDVPTGWRAAASKTGSRSLAPRAVDTVRFDVTVAPDATPTQPYFLDRPMHGAMYDWAGVPPELRGLPFAPPLLRAAEYMRVLGAAVKLEREVAHRYNDQASGELRRPPRVVPVLDVVLSPTSVLWPSTGAASRTFAVTLTYNGTGTAAGRLRLETAPWPAPAAQPFHFVRPGESRMFYFTVRRPAGVTAAAVTVQAVAETEDGAQFRQGVTLIDYPHVRPTPWVKAAEADVRVAPIVLPALAKVGYIRGAADRVPEALTEVGVNVVLLGKDTLEHGDLSGYGAIIVGSRAYEADSGLMRHNDRLLDYAKHGGLVIVQYQQYVFIDGKYAPYPLTIGRPHDRVTDETSPVRMLQPNDPALSRPNRIGGDDWDGWPQERGLYFAHTWDPAYHPVVEMADPGSEPLQGGLLVARYGTGTYVYTGLSFNRALPAAVPGAFRLFLNLLNLKARDVP
jgi:LmbE family N-acetylglucosaminyl deacetylase